MQNITMFSNLQQCYNFFYFIRNYIRQILGFLHFKTIQNYSFIV